MIIAVSGYNASGKTTMVRALHERLLQRGIRARVIRFDSLYLSSHITRRPRREHVLDENNSMGLRKIEAQPGTWDKPFRFQHLVNMMFAAILVWYIRIASRNTVVIFDRYFYDRYINFAETGILYRIANRCTPRPSLALIMLPDNPSWEQRILARVRQRSSLDLPSLSQSDRDELRHVRSRYETIRRSLPCAVTIDTGSQQATEQAWDCVLRKIRPSLLRRASEAAAATLESKRA